MLFGVHVYARAKAVPDLALSRGQEAHRAARLLGDRSIEFLAAGGVAMGLVELGDLEGAERSIDLAAVAASVAPSRPRARQLETWKGMARAAALDAEGMRQHLEHVVAMATEGGLASARCEALARLALAAAGLIARSSPDGSAAVQGREPDQGLVELVERSAAQVKEIIAPPPRARPVGRAGRCRTGDRGPASRRLRGCGDVWRSRFPGAPGRPS